jgi:hypothetical protein
MEIRKWRIQEERRDGGTRKEMQQKRNRLTHERNMAYEGGGM